MSLLASMFSALFEITLILLDLYMKAIITSAVLSWLLAANIINTNNNFVRAVSGFLYRITEPALRPLRRVIPPVNGIDLSPIALYFIVLFCTRVLQGQAAHYMMMGRF